MSEDESNASRPERDAQGPRRHERAEVRERERPRPLVVHAVIRAEGEEELKRPALSVAFSGLAAGLSMGFSFTTMGSIEAGLPDGAVWAPLVGSLGYSVGFLIVTLGRQQLYTETTLTAVLPVLSLPRWGPLGRLLRFWLIVLLSNLTGALAFACVVAFTGIFPPDVQTVLTRIATEAMAHDVWTVFAGAVFAGWLIALIVWLRPVARTAWLWVIIILSYVVGLAGLSHIIAGAIETLYLVVQGEAAWTEWITRWMLPTLLGNTLGGVALVAALNHAQAVVGSDVDMARDPAEILDEESEKL